MTEASRTCSSSLRPGLPGIEIDATFFRPADYVEDSLTTSARRCSSASCCSCWRWSPSCSDLRLTLVSAVSVLVSHGGRRGCAWRSAARRSTDGAGGVGARPRRGHRRRRQRCVLRAPARDATAGRTAASVGARSAAVVAACGVRWCTAPSSCCWRCSVFVLDGEAGPSSRPWRSPTSGAVVASMVVALTVTPALRMLLPACTPDREQSPVLGWLQRRYDRVVAAVRPLGRALVARRRSCCSWSALSALPRSSIGATRWCPSSRTATC